MHANTKQRILVVDDDPNITRLIAKTLESHGYSVHTENSSVNAARIARDFRPHLILLDVSMPEKDGGDVAQELRSHHSTAHAPIIFVTSIVSDDEAGGLAGRIANEHFVPKPVRPRFLAAHVQETLANHERENAEKHSMI